MSTGSGPALFQVVRFWSRRWAVGAGGGPATDPPTRVQDIVLLDAVDAAGATAPAGVGGADGVRGVGGNGADGAGGVTVAQVAAQLGIDRSGASRLVAEAAARGLVTRGISTRDARRAVVAVTPAGRELLAAARAWQDREFERLTADWEPVDAGRFGDYLRRLAAQLAGAAGPGSVGSAGVRCAEAGGDQPGGEL